MSPKHETLTVHSKTEEDDNVIKEYKAWCETHSKIINGAIVELLKKHLKIR
jgi:hypothetical protein